LYRHPPTLGGRKIGVLIGPGFDGKLFKSLVAGIKKEGAKPFIIAPKVGGATDQSGVLQTVDAALNTSPSIFFDAVAILAGPEGDSSLAANPDAVGFLVDAFRHLKVIGWSGIDGLKSKAGIGNQPGVVGLTNLREFLDRAVKGRVWEREAEDAF